MSLSAEIVSQIFSLPVHDRFELANQLLDSIDEADAGDDGFAAELYRRREEMLRGEQVVPDWRAALAEVEYRICAEPKT